MIRKVSKKRQEQLKEYSKIRKEFLSKHPYCQAKIAFCHHVATEVHHMKGRENALLLDDKYFLAVCRSCHNYIETHPKEAKERGWSISRLSSSEP